MRDARRFHALGSLAACPWSSPPTLAHNARLAGSLPFTSTSSPLPPPCSCARARVRPCAVRHSLHGRASGRCVLEIRAHRACSTRVPPLVASAWVDLSRARRADARAATWLRPRSDRRPAGRLRPDLSRGPDMCFRCRAFRAARRLRQSLGALRGSRARGPRPESPRPGSRGRRLLWLRRVLA